MTYTETGRHESEIFDCTYIVGTTSTGEYYYFWTDQDAGENEIPADAIDSPECYHGALIGTLEEIIWEIENCVGSFREHGDEVQAEEAAEIVEELTAAIK